MASTQLAQELKTAHLSSTLSAAAATALEAAQVDYTSVDLNALGKMQSCCFRD